MRSPNSRRHPAVVLASCILLVLSLSSVSFAKTAAEINTSVDAALHLFKKEVKGADEYLRAAKGVLVIPSRSREQCRLPVLCRIQCHHFSKVHDL